MHANNYLTFRKFNDLVIANTIADQLRQNGIEVFVDDSRALFDISFANNSFDSDISIKIRQEDFEKAHRTLENYYKTQLGSVEPDYYLYHFTNEELQEIVAKPDEWGDLDYQLAQHLLNIRGQQVDPQKIEDLKTQRIHELTKPESTQTSWIALGYLSAVLGGVFGIVIGACLAYFKKTLPNGQRIFAYSDATRMQGRIIFFTSLVSFFVWLILRGQFSLFLK